jgi:hypothetical protein
VALIDCPECGHKVSTLAAACPGCGWPTSEATQTQDGSKPPTQAASASAEPSLPQSTSPSSEPRSEVRPIGTTASTRNSARTIKVVAVLVVLGAAGAGLYFKFVRIEHPTREQCETAVSKLYDASGWEFDFAHQTSIEQSVSACLKLSKKEVDCILDSPSRPFSCDVVSSIPIDRVEQGLWCFPRTDNKTETKTSEGCAFSKQRCELRRNEAESSAYGSKLGECEKFPRLYGVYAGAHGDRRSWYGMVPDQKACLLYWRKNGDTLRNVEPGCREVREDASPGDQVTEPQRPLAKWPGKKPGRVWCYEISGGTYGRCYVELMDCEQQRRASKDSFALIHECELVTKAWYFSFADEVEIWADRTMCGLRADSAWNDGTKASNCEAL